MNQLWQEMEKEFSKQWEEPSQENNCCVPATVGKFMGMAQSKEKVVQNEFGEIRQDLVDLTAVEGYWMGLSRGVM